MSGGRPVEEIGMTPQDLAHRLADAFNDKDADAFAALFTEDAEFVNVFGARMRGRAGIAEGHRRVFATTLVGSTLALEELDVLPLGDDVAVCHARWRRGRTADATPATLPPGKGSSPSSAGGTATAGCSPRPPTSRSRRRPGRCTPDPTLHVEHRGLVIRARGE
jgi:uncharacterized protein (TIGR02246 family)